MPDEDSSKTLDEIKKISRKWITTKNERDKLGIRYKYNNTSTGGGSAKKLLQKYQLLLHKLLDLIAK